MFLEHLHWQMEEVKLSLCYHLFFFYSYQALAVCIQEKNLHLLLLLPSNTQRVTLKISWFLNCSR